MSPASSVAVRYAIALTSEPAHAIIVKESGGRPFPATPVLAAVVGQIGGEPREKWSTVMVNWHAVFVPTVGIPEIIVRGTLMYLGLFVILRFIGRRQAGHFGPADLLVIVLIADAAQNGLGKDYQSVTEGIVLVLTIVAWEYFLDWLTWRFPAFRPHLKPPALTLVKDGQLIAAAMRKEMLSEEELAGQLREQGVDDISDVKLARLEGDGRLSVLKR